MEPTIGNLYKAEYSGSAAYQANPEAAVDMTMFSDQIDAVIARAGLSVDDTSKEACQWLLDNSVPLNEENLAYYMELKNLSLPVQAEALLGSMAGCGRRRKKPAGRTACGWTIICGQGAGCLRCDRRSDG